MSVIRIGKSLRMRRLTARGRTVIVAIDHGNAAGYVRGLENPVEIVKICAANGADGILVTPGVLEDAADEVGNLAIILRIDGAVSTHGPGGPMRVFCEVEHAVALGADAVVVNATVGAAHESDELEKVGRIASEGRRWGMPVVAEMLSEGMMANHMDFSGQGQDQLPPNIAHEVAVASRLGVELGADAIKTRYPGEVDAFRRMMATMNKPVLIAGGPMRDNSLRSTLELVDEVLRAGADGVVFGRNIWQHSDPAQALRAVSAMVHDDATLEEALDLGE